MNRRIFHPEKSSGRSSRIAARAFAVLASALLLAPKPLLACAVCMGAESNVRPAINAAIFVMLGFIGSMLAGIGGFAWYLARRARQPQPDYDRILGRNEEKRHLS